MDVRKFITIDPGYSGAIVSKKVNSFRPVDINIYLMPICKEIYSNGGKDKKRNVLDAPEIVEIVKREEPDLIVIEQVASRPNQGAPATFRFGSQFGILQGIAWALEIPLMLIDPHRKRGDEGVKEAVERCVRYYYIEDVWMKEAKSVKPHDGVIDALGMALAVEKN